MRSRLRRIRMEQAEDWGVPACTLHRAADSLWNDIWLIDHRAYARYKRRHQAYIRRYNLTWFGIDRASGPDRTVPAIFGREPAIIHGDVTLAKLRTDAVAFAQYLTDPNHRWKLAGWQREFLQEFIEHESP